MNPWRFLLLGKVFARLSACKYSSQINMPSSQDFTEFLRALDVLRRRLQLRQREIVGKYVGALETRKAGDVRDQVDKAFD